MCACVRACVRACVCGGGERETERQRERTETETERQRQRETERDRERDPIDQDALVFSGEETKAESRFFRVTFRGLLLFVRLG